MPGSKRATVAQRECMRIGEAGVRTDQIELTGIERRLTIGRELIDNPFLAGVDRLHVGPGRGDLQTKALGLLGKV